VTAVDPLPGSVYYYLVHFPSGTSAQPQVLGFFSWHPHLHLGLTWSTTSSIEDFQLAAAFALRSNDIPWKIAILARPYKEVLIKNVPQCVKSGVRLYLRIWTYSTTYVSFRTNGAFNLHIWG